MNNPPSPGLISCLERYSARRWMTALPERDVDAAIRVMEGEVDLDKRNAAIAKAWKIVRDDISYLPLHHQVISWASKSDVDVPIRPNNEPLFRFSSFN